MTSPNAPDVLPYIDELISGSSQGKILWAKANPTTYIWDSQQRGRVILQQVGPAPRGALAVAVGAVPSYILQAISATTGQQMLALQGAEDAQINDALHRLFTTIASRETQAGLDFLKSLLPR
jgi:hypothetical protein